MEPSKTIVFCVNDLCTGGMQRQLVELMRALDTTSRTYHLVTLFTFPERPSLYQELPVGVSVHQLSFSGFLDVPSWFQLWKLLRTLSPDVVVSSLFFSNTVARVLKPFVGYVAIAREHNTYVDKSYPQRIVDRLLGEVSFAIVAVSKTVATFTAAQEHLPKERFRVIPNGIDRSEVEKHLHALPERSELRRRLVLKEHDILVLYVGRLVSQKNLPLLIEGFARLHENRPGSRLILVGDGPLRDALCTKARDLGVSLTVTGHIPRQEVFSYLKAANVLASTSRIEGLSNALLEALAVGVPLAATRTAGTDELLVEGVNGYFIKEETPEAVCNSLERVVAQDYAAAAKESTSVYDIKHTARAYEALFEEGLQRYHRK